ncbi:hypothetical protein LK996_09045 [Lysobacter sp. A6]|uniref:Uncharacterized protein n=1 Tax=Noviluteimonas lactosilytica TaxID=2888523 RepID=A0ABS8JI28_9GAMM|nr:hypothetical protein [Lysobacter lactosilyticus]MCC8363220.1 hypothetical protein [Lysobacter lactosilyticus]
MDDLQALFEADAQRLRANAPTPPPAWRIVQAARANAARRMASRMRWVWRIAALVVVVGAIPLVLHDPRVLPGLVLPLLLGALACWRDEPGAPTNRGQSTIS